MIHLVVKTMIHGIICYKMDLGLKMNHTMNLDLKIEYTIHEMNFISNNKPTTKIMNLYKLLSESLIY